MSPITWWRGARQRLGDAATRSRLERDLDEELQFHIQMQTEENVRLGMNLGEARRQALIRFGGLEGHREALRDLRRLRALEALLADARFALRQFRRTPMLTATMLLVLALGLGVNAALFSVVQSAATLPPAGVARDPGLVRIRGMHSGSHLGIVARQMAEAEVREYSERSELFAAVAAWGESTAVLEPRTTDAWSEPVRAIYVMGDYFGVFGIVPALGTGLRGPSDAGGAPLAAVISHEIWVRHFGRDADAVGRTLRVNGFPVEVAGVAPPAFEGSDQSRDPVLWLPFSARSVLEPAPRQGREVDPAIFSIAARLREGIAATDAAPTVASIASRAPVRDFGDDEMQPSADIVPLLRNNRYPGAEDRVARIAFFYGAATLLILLITCTNVSGLLVGGAMRRRREIAVRLSLGASRWRIVRQLLTESVMLALIASGLAFVLLTILSSSLQYRFPELELVLDWRTMLFAAALAVIAAVGFGLSPALHATRMGVGDVLKDAAAAVSAPRAWLHRALIVVQVALTQPLLVSLGAVVLLVGGDLDSRPSRAVHERIASLTFSMVGGTPSIIGASTFGARREEVERIAERLRSTPGVVAVAQSYDGYSPAEVTVPEEDRSAAAGHLAPLRVRVERASPDYLEVMDIPVSRGRAFLAIDWESEPSEVIIGAELARTLWGEADPIGRRLRRGATAGDSTDYTVVGVVDDRITSMREAGEPRILLAAHGLSGTLLVRTEAPAGPMIPLLRAVASAAAPDSPVSAASTLAAREAADRGALLRLSGIASAAGLLALFLSAIGLYGLIATTVQQRIREIGVRIALGARPGQVARQFFASGVLLTGVGLISGLPVALLALRLFALRVEMPQISTPMLAGLIAAGTLVVAALAAWIPARRAAGGDPLIALRNE